jgi:hypothetical protein
MLAGLLLFGACAMAPPKASPANLNAADRMSAVAMDLPAVPLDQRGLPETVAGFSEREIRAFSDQAQRMMKRSFSTEVAGVEPDAAVEAVLRGLYATSAYRLRLSTSSSFPGAAWEWNIVNRSTRAALESRIVRVAWDASSAQAQLDDGSTARVLTVTLQAHAVVSSSIDRRTGPTYIVRRTIAMSGARPLGGPTWWPSVSILASTWGNDGCELLKSGMLVPLKSASLLETDVNEAEASLQTSGVVQQEKPSASAVEDYLEQCDKDE